MKKIKTLILICSLLFVISAAHAEKITVAAAADLRFAMDEIATEFKKSNPTDEIEVIYGSSGKFNTQIQQGAPYDLYFSADITFPRELAKSGFAASKVKPYGLGRIVLWGASQDASKMTLTNLTDPQITRIAIANLKHAPYGKRAEEALRSSNLWDMVEPKLIYGENIAQTTQFVQTGNAQVGIIALSLAVKLELASKGYIITKRAADNKLAKRFADYMGGQPARAVMTKYGFVLPGEAAGK